MAQPRTLLRTILLTAFVVAVVDGSDAAIYTMIRGRPPEFVYQFIASVFIGKQAYDMGMWSAVLGILIHCCVALTLTSIYFALAGSIEKVTRNWFVSGFLYGLVTWIIINQLIFVWIGIKSSYTQLPPWVGLLNGVGAHVFFVGIPIAFGASRYRRRAGKW